jgi:hypothetical protein
MINFQLSFSIEEIKEIMNSQTEWSNKLSNIFYTTDFYPYWCIDVYIINYIVNIIKNQKEKINENVLNKLINVYFTNLFKFIDTYCKSKIIKKISLKEIKKKHIEYFKKYIGEPWDKLLIDILKPEQMSSWDNYSLAITYIFMNIWETDTNNFYEEHKNREENEIIWKEIVEALPNERMTPTKTLERIKIKMV